MSSRLPKELLTPLENYANKLRDTYGSRLVLQCHLYETTHWILHVARLSRSQRVAKVIKPCCKVPKTEPAEPT
jgi:hypothetical protein